MPPLPATLITTRAKTASWRLTPSPPRSRVRALVVIIGLFLAVFTDRDPAALTR
jgi:hypothetical protein